MAQQGSYQGQAHSGGYPGAGVAVTEVVQPDLFQAGSFSYTLPGALDANQMAAFLGSRADIGVPLDLG